MGYQLDYRSYTIISRLQIFIYTLLHNTHTYIECNIQYISTKFFVLKRIFIVWIMPSIEGIVMMHVQGMPNFTNKHTKCKIKFSGWVPRSSRVPWLGPRSPRSGLTFLLRTDPIHTTYNSFSMWTKLLTLEMTIFGLKMMVKSGLEKIILIFQVPLQSCCGPVQKSLPRKAELAQLVSRYL